MMLKNTMGSSMPGGKGGCLRFGDIKADYDNIGSMALHVEELNNVFRTRIQFRGLPSGTPTSGRRRYITRESATTSVDTRTLPPRQNQAPTPNQW